MVHLLSLAQTQKQENHNLKIRSRGCLNQDHNLFTINLVALGPVHEICGLNFRILHNVFREKICVMDLNMVKYVKLK